MAVPYGLVASEKSFICRSGAFEAYPIEVLRRVKDRLR